MDHKEALQNMAAEKYVLDEFGPEERDAFEEHFFGCEECALDVGAATMFVDQSRAIFQSEKRQATHSEVSQGRPVRPERRTDPERFVRPENPVKPARPVKPGRKDWFGWLRPAFAVPAMALLLGVVFFQNVVQLPEMRRSLMSFNSPEVLPSAYLASGSARGAEEHTITANPGQPFLVLIDIPGNSSVAYIAELYDSAGQKKFSLAIPENAAKESLPLQIPGDEQAGEYSLVIKGAGSGSGEVARYAFALRRQG